MRTVLPIIYFPNGSNENDFMITIEIVNEMINKDIIFRCGELKKSATVGAINL